MTHPDPPLCDVCHVQPMIGVASTCVPFSCAYCRECAERNAQPEWIFDYYKDEGMGPEDIREELITFKDGMYITYKEWYYGDQRQGVGS